MKWHRLNPGWWLWVLGGYAFAEGHGYRKGLRRFVRDCEEAWR